MLRSTLFFLALLLSHSVLAVKEQNIVQKLYNEVNHGVVELHVKALTPPKHGQVLHKSETSNSLGSGVVITDKGRILTAAHVVSRATQIEVAFSDGTKTTGHVVWVDNSVDLAMIQAAKLPENFKALPLAKSGDYNIGEKIVIIGAPYGVSHSLSVGYLSGVRNREKVPGSNLIPRFLQTDASINKGNSGGPMFNLDGEVIGIVSYIMSKTGESNGLGFAVSIDTVHSMINSEPGDFAGFIPILLDEKISQAINNPYGYGFLIQQVIPRTLSDKLGFLGGHFSVMIGKSHVLLGGDILLEIAGIKIKDAKSAFNIKQRMASAKKGDNIPFIFLRDGEKKIIYWQVENEQY